MQIGIPTNSRISPSNRRLAPGPRSNPQPDYCQAQGAHSTAQFKVRRRRCEQMLRTPKCRRDLISGRDVRPISLTARSRIARRRQRNTRAAHITRTRRPGALSSSGSAPLPVACGLPRGGSALGRVARLSRRQGSPTSATEF